MDTTIASAPPGRVSRTLDRVEAVYLRVLRAAILIVATALLVLAAVGAAVALYKISRSPTSVVEKPSAVTAEELVERGSAPMAASAHAAAATPDQRRFYDGIARRYFALYRGRFQRFQRAEDKKLTVSEFDDLTLDTAARLRAVAAGDLSFARDRADLELFLTVVTRAADLPTSQAALATYRRAKKARVATQVQRSRTESRRGWDSYSSDCVAWYEPPIGCAVTRRVSVPYTETVYAMRYPDGMQSPVQQIKAYQDRYFDLLAGRRAEHADLAAAERRSILFGQIEGRAGLGRVAVVIGAFLTLMFFFLLIAIERHQRHLAAMLARAADRTPADDVVAPIVD